MNKLEAKNEKKVFASMQEAVELYFPSYTKVQKQTIDGPVPVSEHLAAELAKQFRANLQR